MKKLLGIVVLGLLLSSKAYAVTLYCDTKEWSDFRIIKVDYNLDSVQILNSNGDIFEETSDERTSEKAIYFKTSNGRTWWKINRITGEFSRNIPSLDFNQIGKCSIKKPKYKKKF